MKKLSFVVCCTLLFLVSCRSTYYSLTEEDYAELVAAANQTISSEKFILEKSTCDTIHLEMSPWYPEDVHLSTGRSYLFINTFINDDTDTLTYSYLINYYASDIGSVFVESCELIGCSVSNPRYGYLCSDSSILVLDNPPKQKYRYISEENAIATVVGGTLAFWVTFLTLLFLFN